MSCELGVLVKSRTDWKICVHSEQENNKVDAVGERVRKVSKAHHSLNIFFNAKKKTKMKKKKMQRAWAWETVGNDYAQHDEKYANLNVHERRDQ